MKNVDLLALFIKQQLVIIAENKKPTPGENAMKPLEGKNFRFYGGYGGSINPPWFFKLNDVVYQCQEEEVDYGYNLLDVVESFNYNPDNFSQTPLAIIKVMPVSDGLFNGWDLVDVRDQHVWLRVGTHIEDYEAWVEFEYTPKQHDEERRFGATTNLP